MASRSLNVTITGDARSLNRALGSVQKQTDTVGKHVGKISHEAKLAFAGIAGTLGVGGLVEGLKSSVEAAQKAQVSQVLMARQLKAVGISYKAHSKAIDEVIAKESALSGLTEHDLQDSFTNIVRATGSVDKGLRGVAVATDLARAKHMDVAKAGVLVAKVYDGNVGALKRLGISLPTVTTAYDKLKASTKHATAEQIAQAKAADKVASGQNAMGVLQKRLAGQAEAYGKTSAGAQDRFRVAVEKLQEKIGKALLPTLTHVADKAAKFVTQMTDGTGAGGRFAKKMDDVFKAVGRVLGTVKDVAGWLGKHPALLAAAGAAWVAYKTAAIAQIAIVKTASLGLFGPSMKAKLGTEAESAGTSIGKGFAAKAGLAAAAGIGGWEIGKWLRANIPAVRNAGNAIGKELGQAIFGGSDLQNKVDNLIGRAQDIRNQQRSAANANPTSPGHGVIRPHGGGKGQGGPRGTGHATAHGSAVVAHASSPVASASSVVATSASTGSYGLANLICSKFGLRISSGYRSPQYNAAIGGAPNSWHTHGSVSNPGAIDMVGSMGQMQAALAWVQANVSGLAEAMIDNYAGLGWNLHISGPGLMNWNGASTGGSSAPSAPSSARAPSSSHAHTVSPAVRRAAARKHAQSVARTQATHLKAEKKREAAGWAKVKADIHTAKHAGDVVKSVGNPWLQAYFTHIDRMVDAGDITQTQGDQMKIDALNKALPSLTGEALLVARGQIKSLTDDQASIAASASAPDTSAADLKASIDALTDEMKQNRQFATSVTATQLGQSMRALADFVNGQIFGNYGMRANTASAGAIARY